MWFLQGLAGVLGSVLLLYVVFSYEDEEKKVQSWLEEAWVALDDKDKNASTRIRDFLQRIVKGILQILSRVYGGKIISLESFAAAYFFCVMLMYVHQNK